MDRRALSTGTVLGVDAIAATSGASLALPRAPARDAIAPEAPVGNV